MRSLDRLPWWCRPSGWRRGRRPGRAHPARRSTTVTVRAPRSCTSCWTSAPMNPAPMITTSSPSRTSASSTALAAQAIGSSSPTVERHRRPAAGSTRRGPSRTPRTRIRSSRPPPGRRPRSRDASVARARRPTPLTSWPLPQREVRGHPSGPGVQLRGADPAGGDLDQQLAGGRPGQVDLDHPVVLDARPARPASPQHHHGVETDVGQAYAVGVAVPDQVAPAPPAGRAARPRPVAKLPPATGGSAPARRSPPPASCSSS